ncbi:MAG: nucleotidyl transferase AbiEii/AbiGii toxin family protein [Acidobacteria bacterium]|nr:nucleotidyl transferase AbiEii/AbiGii toxin family protein [Acidobacteriota bacterium]
MKDRALEAALRFDDPGRRLNALREYLQGFILRSLHESEASRAVVFVGGTALRFLEDLPRFSEDLDFSRIASDGYDPVRWLDKLKRDLHLAGFDSAVRWIDRKPVQVAWIRTASLLVEAGLSGHPKQKLSIKVEIDTRPPAGATVLRSVITRHFTFVIAHHDLPSLMAGKLHALLTRPWPKGRDWFDLVWYRSRRPPVAPNLPFLQRALDQTQGAGRHRAADWPRLLRARLAAVETGALIRDVEPFLERPADAALLERVNLNAVLAASAEPRAQ